MTFWPETRLRLLLTSLLLAIVVAPIAGHAAEVVLGAVYPAHSDARHAIDTALDIVNGTHERIPVLMGQGGGLDRLGGAALRVTFADDADPAKAAEHLVTDDHAQALIGGLSDAAASAISRVAEQHGIPFLSLDSTLANTGGLTWFFRIARPPANDNDSVQKLLGALADGRSLDGIAVVPADSPAAPEGAFRGVSYTVDPLPARPGVPEVEAAYQAKAGKPLDTVAARELTGVLLLADVINRAASTKPIDLRTALMATDTPGSDTPMLWDGIRFDDTGQNVLATPALQQWQHGRFQIVAPDTIAAATVIWPTAK